MSQVEIVTGDVFEDISDAASDVVDTVSTAVEDVWKKIPGSQILGDAVKDFMTGPFRDFAKSWYGEAVLRAFSTMAMMGAAAVPVFAPAAMATAATIPGLAQGKNFKEAAIQEWGWRLETLATVLTPMVAEEIAKATGDAVQKALSKAQEIFPNLDPADALTELGNVGISAETLKRGMNQFGVPTPTIQDAEKWAVKAAEELGVRPDALLQGYDLNSGTRYFDPSRWNPYTGLPNFIVKAPLGTEATVSQQSKTLSALAPSFQAPTGTTATVQRSSKTLDYLRSQPQFKAPIAQTVSTAPSSFQATLSALRDQQAASPPPVPGGLHPSRDAFSMTEVAESKVWEKYKVPILVLGGVVLLGGIYVWSKR